MAPSTTADSANGPPSTANNGSHKKSDRVGDWQENKRRKLDDNGEPFASKMSIPFSADEIAAEGRRPKRKVAVMVGYAGTGYKGMQINHEEKTIEGDIFAAFVAAGAISKANANDPKKSSLVRCARTDKGVHAAGNVISLKLIIEDPDLVQKINDNLPAQIRVWDIQRTNNAFSCYQACDSRWYEYLLPSYSLLPPHPDSYLGKNVIAAAKETGTYDEWSQRLEDVQGFWETVEENEIKPILEKLDSELKEQVLRLLHASENKQIDDDEKPQSKSKEEALDASARKEEAPKEEGTTELGAAEETPKDGDSSVAELSKIKKEFTPAELVVREIKAAYVAAKRRYRVTPTRLQQLQSALDLYVGTHNFHNYTVQKSHKDPSAKRHIKSFVVNPTPILIRDTEWLSLKVHGQSFMMHQIRKMVAMAVMCVRYGAPISRITDSYEPRNISIPKAPGLGLLLERPVFENYNKRATDDLGKATIDFSRYDKQIQEFKDKEIYTRMWDVEEKENSFHIFFNQLDNFSTAYFLWVTAHGFKNSYERKDKDEVPRELAEELGDDDGDPNEGEG
ncbi:putative trna pseudouridine synthase protein [Phaeoacremonium minimum UCRPA7]|uniref:tRNA pseudouridine synthase 1 n=1 Tax=Phaeoacremonium minimum (strain UCR-PA7) TaxID=1286976 RepID=R8BQ35_PHAM7|nr:putative trna pseudouridine synthase protein [Phaeoacremonium minimum UCRPA7]EOO01390.1 putative trna pseudouridine synthase protein [Phaeoacremonium minimum UCRPA7]